MWLLNFLKTFGILLGHFPIGLSMSIIEDEGGESDEEEAEENSENSESEENGSGSGEGEGEEKEDFATLTQRYKDLQSHTSKQLSDKDAKIGQYENLLAPHSNNIKRNDDGSMEFNFGEQKPQTDELTMPTEQEIMDKPLDGVIRAAEYAVKKALAARDEKDAVAHTKAENDAKQKKYSDDRVKAWGETVKLFPQLVKNGVVDKTSRLYIEADKILKETSNMTAFADCEKVATELAAGRLGIKAVRKGNSKRNGNNLIGVGGAGNGAGSSSNGEISDEDFLKLSPVKRNEYIERIGATEG